MEDRNYAFRTDDRKRAILETASRVFAEHGYDGASLAQVSHAAGLSQAGLLHHYPSKELLLIAVLAFRDSEAAAGFQMEAIPGFLSAADGIVAMFAGQMQRPELVSLFVKIAAEATNPQHPAHAWAVERYGWTRDLYTAMAQRDIDAGLVKPEVKADMVARGLIAMMDGLQLQYLIEGEMDGAVEHFADYVAGLVAFIRA